MRSPVRVHRQAAGERRRAFRDAARVVAHATAHPHRVLGAAAALRPLSGRRARRRRRLPRQRRRDRAACKRVSASVKLALGGRVLINDAGDDVQLALGASGAGASLPYTDLLAPDSNVRAVALFTQPPGDAFRVRGTIATVGPTRGAGTFAVDPARRRRVRPVPLLALGRLAAGRRIRARAADLSERGLALYARLPAGRRAQGGVAAGRADPDAAADLRASSTPTSPPPERLPRSAWAARSGAATCASKGYALGTGSVRLGGTFSDVRLADIRVDGPLGRFGGRGRVLERALRARRKLRRDAARPRRVHHRPERAGRGPRPGARDHRRQNRIVVQTTGADFSGAARPRRRDRSRQRHARGREQNAVRIIAAEGSIGGARAVAADTGGPFLVSAPALPVAALRGTGVPIQAGTLTLFGVADLRGTGPSFDGLVALARRGRVGPADQRRCRRRARRRHGARERRRRRARHDLRRLRGTGRRDRADRSGALAYDLAADVPIGDVDGAAPHAALAGEVLGGQLRRGGARARLAARSRACRVNVTVPEGSYNGLSFRDGARGDRAQRRARSSRATAR
jgi:hypothetical protein